MHDDQDDPYSTLNDILSLSSFDPHPCSECATDAIFEFKYQIALKYEEPLPNLEWVDRLADGA